MSQPAGEIFAIKHRSSRASPGILLLVTAPCLTDSPIYVDHENDIFPDLLALGLGCPSSILIRCLNHRRHLSHGLVNRGIADLHGVLYVKDRTGETRLVFSV